MNLIQQLKNSISEAINLSFSLELKNHDIALQPTKREFEGDLTFVTFALSKNLKMAPAAIAAQLAHQLQGQPNIASTNVVQGFLNIKLTSQAWLACLQGIDSQGDSYWKLPSNGLKVMVEYSSPNTNKPLHLGHMRNNFLGFSVAQILKANGYEVLRSSVVNNRGIHICKSMLAYQKFGNGQTPASTGLKGDHLVGKYYVEFDKAYKLEIEQLMAGGLPEDEAKKQAPLMKEAQQMLLQWEQGNPEVHAIWAQMNAWVYEGFDQTYASMGVAFEKVYYESDLYLNGKETVQQGLTSGIFYQKPDGSVWIDLSAEGLDHKLVLRADGTAVYITQDLGLADKKFEDYPMDKSIYVVGNEQDYHFDVLFATMKKLGRPYAVGLYHLSYGMVDLPSGKMKSREGTVVDADELIAEMEATAEAKTTELGKTTGFTAIELQNLYHTLGLGALKYFLLKVDPKKRMLFNPAESIEFQGNTGPFIQYTYARINAIMRKSAEKTLPQAQKIGELLQCELEIIKLVNDYPQILAEAAQAYSPAIIAQYVYDVAKAFNSLYAEVSILGEENPDRRQLRIGLSRIVAQTISNAMALLGISVPDRM
jgi:arginyl-tRNA synthetase